MDNELDITLLDKRLINGVTELASAQLLHVAQVLLMHGHGRRCSRRIRNMMSSFSKNSSSFQSSDGNWRGAAGRARARARARACRDTAPAPAHFRFFFFQWVFHPRADFVHHFPVPSACNFAQCDRPYFPHSELIEFKVDLLGANETFRPCWPMFSFVLSFWINY